MILTIEPKEIIQSITQHKLRNILTGFGIAWGIFIMMLMMGFGDSFQKGIFNVFSGFAENTIIIWGGETSLPFKGELNKRKILFDEEFLHQTKVKFNEIENISIESNSPESMALSYDENKVVGSILGVNIDFFKIKKQKIKTGRLFIHKDFEEEKNICIIPESLQKILFKKKAKALGEYINIGGNYFRVVGITKSSNVDFGDRNSVIIPYSSFMSLYNTNTSNKFIMSLYKDVNGSDFMTLFNRYMASSYQYNSEDNEAIYVYNLSDQVKEFQSLFSGIKIFIWFVGFCILLTGIISVGNIMYVNINERTREIGIRKAIGATPRNILEMILIESVVLTSIAGFIGMFFGYIVIQLIKLAIKSMADDNMFLENVGINPPVIIGSLTILILSGMIAGILPAIKASKIRPVIALNQEN